MLPALIAAAGIFQAGATIYGAKKASTEAKYNAKIKDQQAQMIGSQMGLESGQWDREMGRASSTLYARVGKAGITMSGSPMAALLDMETQMEMDKSISLYNLEWQKRGVQSEADAYRRQSKSIMQQGYVNTFSSLLSTGANYGTAKG